MFVSVALAVALAQEPALSVAEEPAPGREGGPSPTVVRPFEMPAVVPTAPDPSRPRRAPDVPVRLDEYRGQYEDPKDVVQLRFERGVADNLRRASALAGPLEGRWRVDADDGTPLLALVLFHTGEGGVEVEGAWRDLSRPGRLGASGPIASAERDAAGALTLRYTPAGASTAAVLSLELAGPRRWTGVLASPGEAARPVIIVSED